VVRALVFTLALVTSPVGAVVCEVVCAGGVGGHHAAPATDAAVEGHDHHGHMAMEAAGPAPRAKVTPPAGTSSAFTSQVEDCAPASGQPAIRRTPSTSHSCAPAADVVVTAVYSLALARQHTGGPPVWSSPPPPLLSTIPLRI